MTSMKKQAGSRRKARYEIHSTISRNVSLKKMEDLLREGHSPDSTPPGCPPPLYRAVRFNRPDIALALLKAGCRVKMSKRQREQYPPIICIAAHLNMTEVVMKLCRHPECDAFAADDNGHTIAHIAVMRKNYDLLKSLFHLDCSNSRKYSTLRDGMCFTPLHLAASRNDVTALQLLLMLDRCWETPCKSLSTDEEQSQDIHSSAAVLSEPMNSLSTSQTYQHVNMDTSKQKISSKESYTSTKARTQTQLQTEESTVKSCLNSSVKVHALDLCNSASELHEIIDAEKAETSGELHLQNTMCESLRIHSRDMKVLDEYENSIESKVTENGQEDVFDGRYADVDPFPIHQQEDPQLINLPVLGTKETMLHFAAKGHHLEMVEYLIYQGADVNAVDLRNNTPLHILFRHGSANRRAVAAARLLLMAGVDYTIRSSDKYCRKLTVGMMAAARNKVAYLKLLKEFGAQFDEVDQLNRTVLMLALFNGSEEAAWFLLTRCPRKEWFFTWVDNKNFSALHYVLHCESKAVSLTQLMLDQGYGAAMQSEYTNLQSCLNQYAHFHISGPRRKYYTPVTWAICHGQLGVLKTLVAYDPSCLLQCYRDLASSPLHTALTTIPDKECIPFIDFLLAHGSDGNAVVCNFTPYEYAMQGKDSDYNLYYTAAYLKKKLGVFFLQFGYTKPSDADHSRSDCPPKGLLECLQKKRFYKNLWRCSLRDVCLNRVRELVRKSVTDYYAGITSLQVPQNVISDLLFESSCCTSERLLSECEERE